MSAVLTAKQALKLVGEMFVYHMPFNRALGMELERYEKEFAQLAFKNQPMMVGNWAQSILHGGVIASALDVAAGLVCVGSTLTRHETISEDELRQRLSRMGTIDLRVDYLRPGRGERFIALGLAFSFAFYGLVRKKIAVEAQTGMLIETMWLLPVAAIYLFAIADSSTSHMGQNPMSLNLLLIAAGIVTTVPLLCFTAAATRLRLSTLGFFQYIGPTLMFLLAVTFYGEKPGADKMVTFAFIWVALAIFVMDAIYTQRRKS